MVVWKIWAKLQLHLWPGRAQALPPASRPQTQHGQRGIIRDRKTARRAGFCPSSTSWAQILLYSFTLEGHLAFWIKEAFSGSCPLGPVLPPIGLHIVLLEAKINKELWD